MPRVRILLPLPKKLTARPIGRAVCVIRELYRASNSAGQCPVEPTAKKPPCLLDKAALGCYIGVSKNGCQCKWRSSLVDFSSVEIAAYRSGGRLFLMSEGRYDQRRKTDEHQRVCKHICICDHIAHPLFREVDNLPFLPTRLSYHAARPLSIFTALRCICGASHLPPPLASPV